MDRSLVVFISPPHHMRSGAKSFPNLGILSLASYIEQKTSFEAAYFDGAVCSKEIITSFLVQHHSKIFAVGASLISSNLSAGLSLCADVKALDPSILTIVGNDAFSADPEKILQNHPSVDYGFAGNEIYGPLAQFLMSQRIQKAHDLSLHPSLVWRNERQVVCNSGAPEAVFTDVDYGLLDRTFPHSSHYDRHFRLSFSDYSLRLPDHLPPRRGITVEIARGCIKFSGGQACSFCSIQSGGMSRNQVDNASIAWGAIEHASKAGYDTLFLTADEWPLTFPSLLREMSGAPPDWWKAIPENRRPILVGYARADGLQKEAVVANMRSIGFRILFVGVDANEPVSLLAMNKVLRPRASIREAEKLCAANFESIENARKHGIILICGIVLGHIGMTRELLEKNVTRAREFLEAGRDVIASVDVQVLSPEHGSRDYQYLANPELAEATASQLSLVLAEKKTRHEIAARYVGDNGGGFKRAVAKQDYITALMPELDPKALRVARANLIRHALGLGIDA